VRIVPRILPPYVSALFWTLVLVGALLLLHLPVGRWLDDLVTGKAVVIAIALVVAGVRRLRVLAAARGDRPDASAGAPER
jgi:hypothetical protein